MPHLVQCDMLMCLCSETAAHFSKSLNVKEQKLHRLTKVSWSEFYGNCNQLPVHDILHCLHLYLYIFKYEKDIYK